MGSSVTDHLFWESMSLQILSEIIGDSERVMSDLANGSGLSLDKRSQRRVWNHSRDSGGVSVIRLKRNMPHGYRGIRLGIVFPAGASETSLSLQEVSSPSTLLSNTTSHARHPDYLTRYQLVVFHVPMSNSPSVGWVSPCRLQLSIQRDVYLSLNNTRPSRSSIHPRDCAPHNRVSFRARTTDSSLIGAPPTRSMMSQAFVFRCGPGGSVSVPRC